MTDAPGQYRRLALPAMSLRSPFGVLRATVDSAQAMASARLETPSLR